MDDELSLKERLLLQQYTECLQLYRMRDNQFWDIPTFLITTFGTIFPVVTYFVANRLTNDFFFIYLLIILLLSGNVILLLSVLARAVRNRLYSNAVINRIRQIEKEIGLIAIEHIPLTEMDLSDSGGGSFAAMNGHIFIKVSAGSIFQFYIWFVICVNLTAIFLSVCIANFGFLVKVLSCVFVVLILFVAILSLANMNAG
ncbi:MAG TPA: hypothetical protein PKV16_05005 [Caldisericia bacterium]|nr:hypothetical protein [Caldisericia bacterium]HPF48671.1 hypothetical protein [Caldisericia bacterium]HPI83669.1 hypothetical protein [Caldisericia bacterium]HPQ93126.1 hypothetical protein [Caldisericia bacterium]HRV75041.1 hypothetical protein [Caldisericia bacterium]